MLSLLSPCSPLMKRQEDISLPDTHRDTIAQRDASESLSTKQLPLLVLTLASFCVFRGLMFLGSSESSGRLLSK